MNWQTHLKFQENKDQCYEIENKWRVLERYYKKVVGNNNKIGLGRNLKSNLMKFFDKKKTNIRKCLLLQQKKRQENPNPQE